MSRLKHDKLSDMLAAANAAQQAAEQKSRRLEIKFARSDKGHALMRSAKFQASVTDLEAQVTQLQQDAKHKVGLHHQWYSVRASMAGWKDQVTQLQQNAQHKVNSAMMIALTITFLLQSTRYAWS